MQGLQDNQGFQLVLHEATRDPPEEAARCPNLRCREDATYLLHVLHEPAGRRAGMPGLREVDGPRQVLQGSAENARQRGRTPDTMSDCWM